MRRHLTAALAVCLATLGLAAGLFAFPARADNTAGAKSLDDLWAMGYVIGLRGTGATATNPLECANLIVLSANGVPFPDGQEPFVELNPDPNKPGCRTPPDQIQANIDWLVANWPSAPQPVTTTATTDVAPAVTAPSTPAGTSATPATPGGTTTVTVTVTDPTVQAQLDALNAKLDALNTKVDKLSVAGTAAWDAFKAAVDGGASPADAALAARSGYLNSLYGL